MGPRGPHRRHSRHRADKPLPPGMRAVLRIGTDVPVKYRHMALAFGTRVVVETYTRAVLDVPASE